MPTFVSRVTDLRQQSTTTLLRLSLLMLLLNCLLVPIREKPSPLLTVCQRIRCSVKDFKKNKKSAQRNRPAEHFYLYTLDNSHLVWITFLPLVTMMPR